MSNEEKIILTVLASCVFFLAVFKIYDPDIWFHLATGRDILETHRVPTKDIFSYTAQGGPWLDTSWLTQVIFYSLYLMGGYNALILFKAGIIVFAFSIVFLAMKKREALFPISVLVILLAVAITRHRFTVRPHIFSLVFLAAYSYTLFHFVRGERESFGSSKSLAPSKLIWLLLPLQAIWANMHSESLLGIALVFAYFVSALIELAYSRFFKKEDFEWRHKLRKTRMFFLLLLGISFVSFLNPNGWKSLAYGYFTLKEDIFRLYVVEFRSANFFQEPLPFRFFVFLGAASFLLNPRRRLEDILIFIGFFYLAINVVRFKPNFIVASSPAVAEAASRSLAVFFSSEELTAWQSGLRKRFANLALLGVIAYVTVSQIAEKGQWTQFGLGVNEVVFPKRAVDFIERENVQGNMYNPMGFGGYLLWHLYPERKVFIDGRTDVYGPHLLYKDVYYSKPEIWAELMEEYNFDYVIVSNLDIIKGYPCRHLDSQRDNWALVLWDDCSLMYLRRDESNKTLIEKYAYRYVLPNNPDLSYLDAYLNRVSDRVAVIQELERNLNDNPGCLSAHISLAYVYSRIDEDEKAIEHLEKAIEITPYNAELYGRLGAIYQKKGMEDLATKEYKAALKIDPKHVPSRLNLGAIYFLKREYKKALYQFRQALKVEPENEGIKNNALLALEAIRDADAFRKPASNNELRKKHRYE